MKTLHMQPEQVRELAHFLDQQVVELEEARSSLQRSSRRLSMAWQAGGKSERFQRMFQNWLRTYQRQVHEIELLTRRLAHEVDEWERADRNNAGKHRNLIDRLERSIDRLRPGSWVPVAWAGILLPIGRTLEEGIAHLYDTGLRTYRSTREYLEQAGDAAGRALGKAVRISDLALDGAFQKILSSDPPGSDETLKFKIEGEVTIPGAGFSGKLIGAGEGALTRNKDGTYTLTLSAEGGAGVEEDLIEAKGEVRIGQNTYGLGVDVDAEAVEKRNVDVSFTFDPNKPGDLTKMAAFMSSLGLTAQPGTAALVGPALYTLKDNLSGLSVGAGVEGGVSANAHVLVNLAEVDVSVTAGSGLALEKVNGEWQASNSLELGAEGHVSLYTRESGLEVKATLEDVRNLTTGSQSARVTLEISAEAGRDGSLFPQDAPDYASLSKYLPENVDLKSLEIKVNESNGLVIEYTLDQPVETVREALQVENGQPDWGAIVEHSDLELRQVTAAETGLGIKGEVGAATESIGLGGEATMTRESERVLFSTK